jgi:phytanoyl-CoA hydroxylase
MRSRVGQTRRKDTKLFSLPRTAHEDSRGLAGRFFGQSEQESGQATKARGIGQCKEIEILNRLSSRWRARIQGMANHHSSAPTAAELHSQSWEKDGFFLLRNFATSDFTSRMLDRAIEIAREGNEEKASHGALILPESNLVGRLPADAAPEKRVSKIFRLHRDRPFLDFVEFAPVTQLLTEMLGPAVDCFLSQFIFKHPGAWGQPWHQDEFYFHFDRSPEIGLWLAVTEATLTNGCLHVIPGSHREPVHEHVPDRRPGANFGYLEIVDHDMTPAVPVLMNQGDLLVFHSRLMHKSYDNETSALRAALVMHFAPHGTTDRDAQSPVNDWMQVTPASRPSASSRPTE